ncbi:MAG: nucleotidyltransferase family protein [Vicinamibacterales bacterium]
MLPPLTLENRLILACARTDADVQRIAALVGEGPDWQAFLQKAERWGLAPLVHMNLRQSDHVPADAAQRLRHLSHHEKIHGLARRELLRMALTRFAEAQVPVIVLKGAVLATVVYPSPGLRPMRDIDLLVRRRDQDRVEAVLRSLRDTLWARQAAPAAQPRNPYLKPESVALLDIRQDVFPAGSPDGLPAAGPVPIADFWARARSAHIESVGTLIFAPEDLLLHLSFHLTVAAGSASRVRTLCDIGEVCRYYRETLEWTQLIDRACSYGLEKPLYSALRLAEEMVEAGVPPRVLEDLRVILIQQLDEHLITARRTLLEEDRPADNSSSADLSAAAGQSATPSSSPLRTLEKITPSRTASGERLVRTAGEVAVTYDQGMTDGVGSQLHRIFGFYALARALEIKYIHSGLRDVGYQGLMPLLNGRLDPDFTARYNAFFSLPSDDFDLEGCERVRVHSLDGAAVARCQEQAAATGRPLLIQGHLPYAYINRHPAGYQALREVSPYRGFRPAGPVRVCIHLRRGDNSVQSREQEFPQPLQNAFYVRACSTVVDALRQLGLPFVVRLHTELPPRPYALHPGIPGVYFNLDRPTRIDPADYALEDFEALPNLEMVLNVEPRECLDDFATADVLILSLSSLGFVGGLLNPHGCVICPESFHAALPDWLVASRTGGLDAAQVATRLAGQLRGRPELEPAKADQLR